MIIVTWNSRDDIQSCLRSVLEDSPHLSRQVIVVDNASKDGTPFLVQREFPGIQLVRNERNLGFARGVNQGLLLAGGRLILLLNPDTSIVQGALEEMAGLLEEREDVGAVAPQLIFPDGRVQSSCRRFPTPVSFFWEIVGLSRLFPRSSRFNRWKMGDFDHRSLREVDQPMASCLMLKRNVVEEVGPLDERFPMFFNDVDWCLRIKEAGWKIFYLPSAKVIHTWGGSTRRIWSRMIISAHTSAISFLRKHAHRPRDRVATVLVSTLLIGAGLVRILLDQLWGRRRR